MFADRATIFVKGGDGGDGCLSFRREKYVPRGGPDGGDGGDGGSVIIRASTNHTNLAHLSHQRFWRAERGGRGEGSNRFGKTGKDLIIEVPAGTVIHDRDRGHVLRDLKNPDDSVNIAQGGKGGRGNTFFKSATNRAPRQFEKGQPGEERWLILELKVIADVGLIGLPNAGKSTLLSRISRAQPEIADYPFTTKYPNLGTVMVDPEHAFVVADIPGLIEGAHEGLGLGHEFLRHVERSGLLVHLVEAIPMDESDPVHNYRMIRNELEQYSPALAKRPELVAVTKMDLTGADEARDRIAREIGRDVLSISAVTGEGIPALLRAIVAGLASESDEDDEDGDESASPTDAGPTSAAGE